MKELFHILFNTMNDIKNNYSSCGRVIKAYTSITTKLYNGIPPNTFNQIIIEFQDMQLTLGAAAERSCNTKSWFTEFDCQQLVGYEIHDIYNFGDATNDTDEDTTTVYTIHAGKNAEKMPLTLHNYGYGGYYNGWLEISWNKL